MSFLDCFRSVLGVVRSACGGFAGTLILWTAQGFGTAQAALPTPVAPSNNPASGDWLELIKGYIKDGGLVLGLAISVIAFLWVSYVAIAKFNEARTGRAEWAEVGLTGIVAAAVLVFIGFLLTEAAGVIT